MAQAARLNLRLQKELKLLLTDPPPGAFFPLLSSSSSLTTIDAQIKGPEGTVYAEGVFNIKIQIPERYPFQPPSVTFATPIYHPNIDTGGRICLDILNLPPKGAWQPSLNISTVLTSIGLLLSEPNADDGLMCEASREFKYNRQAFDQKARSMTHKYAQAAAATGSVCDTHAQTQSHANPITVQVEVETTNHELMHEANEPVVSYKKVTGGSRKLSLESSGQTIRREANGEGNQVPQDQVFLSDLGNHIDVQGRKRAVKDTLDRYNQSQEKLCGSRRKLSLESHGQSQKNSDNGMENVVPNHCPSIKPGKLPVPSSGSLVMQSGNSYKRGLHQSQDNKLSVDGNINSRTKKLGQLGNKLSVGSLNTSQMINESNDEMLITPQLLSSQSCSNVASEPLPMAPALDSEKWKPHKGFVDETGNGSTDTSRKKLCLGGKKLSLRHKSSSEAHGEVNKENVVPHVTEYDDGGLKNGGANGSHRECGMAPLQEDGNKNMLPQFRSVSSYLSKSVPKQQENLSWEGKQQSDQGQHCEMTRVIKPKEAERSAITESEAVIVLDSESSDNEERSRPSQSKSLLARRRIGKGRIRA